VATLAGLVALLLIAGSAFGETAAPNKACPVATGPIYKPPGEKPRATYRVAAFGVPCSFAVGWMRRFAARQIRRDPTLLAGPPGWTCFGLAKSGWRLKGYEGLCTNGARKFTWAPRFYAGE
jgi:hypothetical protein